MASQLLSLGSLRRIIIALASATRGNEVANFLEAGNAVSAQTGSTDAAAIIATSVSTTVDFAALKVGDLIVHVPAVAGNSNFETVVTAGTKPSAAVVGDLYIVKRAYSAPAAHAFKL